MTVNSKVYWMEVSGGEGYRHTFWFTSVRARKQAREKVAWAEPDAKIKYGHGTEYPAATVKRMVKQGLKSPYQRRARHELGRSEGQGAGEDEAQEERG
jgi:hypothetical protein